jgi:hypothetical protein
MNEQDLRVLVREAIERHLGRPAERVAKRDRESLSGAVAENDSRSRFDRFTTVAAHPSHMILKVFPGSEIDDGMCVIEPSVRCNHCGFCQSFGH